MPKRICLIGAGRWGQNHLRVLNQLDSLAGIVDSRADTLADLSRDYPGVPTFTNASDALAEQFDGFIIATPTESHHELATLVLEHGAPVLVEKPLTPTAAEARDLQRLSLEKGVSLMVGHVLLFHPAIQKIKTLLTEGRIGKLQYLYSNRLNLGTVRKQESILWSFAPHDISIFQHLIGEFPIEVTSRGAAFLQPHIHDSTMTLLRYPNNVVGHIFVSWLHPYKEHRLVLIGSKGMLSFEDSSREKNLLFYEKGIDWVQGEPIKREGPTENVPYERKMPLTAELEYFIEHIESPSVELAGGREATEVLEVLELARESLLSEREVPSSRAGTDRRFFAHPSSYVDDGAEIGDGTKIWHFSHVQSGARIGRDCTLGQNVNVGDNVVIGDHVKIQNGVSIFEGVTLEDHVFCGPAMVFTNVSDPRARYPKRGAEGYERTLVREGASIGANATIVCGHTIGRHALIGAGAVVTTDVPDYSLMVGVPARQAGWVCECGERRPDTPDDVKCSRCNRKSRIRNGCLVIDV